MVTGVDYSWRHPWLVPLGFTDSFCNKWKMLFVKISKNRKGKYYKRILLHLNQGHHSSQYFE